MKTVTSYSALEDLGRVRLSQNFFMRDFLHSEIAAWHGLRNVPQDADAAIAVGRRLCEDLLEPLQATFGRLHIRSGYRSLEVNALGNANGLNCASNEANFAAHIWDRKDAAGRSGATVCIVIPWLVDHVAQGGQWQSMAWWIHDHLPYSQLTFFKHLCAFNIQWREQPERRIDSFVAPKGCLTRDGMENHRGSHADQYAGFPTMARMTGLTRRLVDPVPMERAAPVPTPSPKTIEPEPPRRAAASVKRANQTPPAPPEPEPPIALSSATPTRIFYRAVHTRTLWRKASGHRTLDGAILGKDGAKALFARKVRIDYEKHGEPVLVLVWEEAGSVAYVVVPDSTADEGVRVVTIPAERAWAFEQQSGVPGHELRGLVAM